MHRHAKSRPQRAKLRQGAATVAHIVFSVNFQPPNASGVCQNIAEMLRLIANPHAGWQMGGKGALTHWFDLWQNGGPAAASRGGGRSGRYIATKSRSSAVKLPMRAVPSAAAGNSMVVQVPAGTKVQALP